MDLDARMRELKTLKDRLEGLFDGGALRKLEALAAKFDGGLLERLEAALARFDGDDAGAGAALVDDVKKHVDEIAETVTGIQQQLDAIGPKLNAVEKLADPAVLEMLDWLARNREAIDVLLTLGETVDDEATTDAAEKPADEQAGS
jgi:hypothetical protein